MTTLPRSAETLLRKAGEHGWRVQGAQNDDSLALVLSRGGRHLLASWKGGAWQHGVVLDRGDAGVLRSTQVGQLVAGSDEEFEQCVDEIAARNRGVRVERETATREKNAAKREGKR